MINTIEPFSRGDKLREIFPLTRRNIAAIAAEITTMIDLKTSVIDNLAIFKFSNLPILKYRTSNYEHRTGLRQAGDEVLKIINPKSNLPPHFQLLSDLPYIKAISLSKEVYLASSKLISIPFLYELRSKNSSRTPD